MCLLGIVLLALLIQYRPRPKPKAALAIEDFWVELVAPKVFRSVMDGESRMLTLRLHDQLWVTYQTESGVLRKAWRDGVDFKGAVHNGWHGPQPKSKGAAYLKEPRNNLWKLVSHESTSTPTIVYAGHRFAGGNAILMFRLIDDLGNSIEVEETPQVEIDAAGRLGLKRSFTTRNVPDDILVTLDVQLASLATSDCFHTNGNFESFATSNYTASGTLALNSHGITTLTCFFGPPDVKDDTPIEAPMDEGFKLISQNDCSACHDTNVKTVGPPYRSIADHYRTRKVAISELAGKVIAGSSGTWGDTLMTPHPNLTQVQAETMVASILKLDAPQASSDAGRVAERSRAQQLKDTLHIWKRDYEISRLEKSGRPGDTLPLDRVHPSFKLEKVRPDSFQPRVGGLDLFDDGRIALCTWDARGSVYLLTPSGDSSSTVMTTKEIAAGLAEPLGLKIVDGIIYVIQKQELTRLIDEDGDDIIDRYEAVSYDWGATANFHEFAFGLAYHNKKLLVTLATAVAPGGVSAANQDPDRGSVVSVDPVTGKTEILATGLRVPNGIGGGIEGEIFITDNEGNWLPANKLLVLKQGAFYGSRAVDLEGTETTQVTRPAVLLPRDEIANSPSQPATLNLGPYKNQMICGDATHGGIKRFFLERIDGEFQGALFRFSQGLEAGVNRLVWDSEKSLLVGCVGGGGGNWFQDGKLTFGLQRMVYTGSPVFEMLAIRAQPTGFEIEFTSPLATGSGKSVSDYRIEDWTYRSSPEYGGPKIDSRTLKVAAVSISPDRMKATLTIDDLKSDRVVYFHLKDSAFRSDPGTNLWSTEAWYTLNKLPNP